MSIITEVFIVYPRTGKKRLKNINPSLNISGPRIILPSDIDSAAQQAKHGAMVEMCLFEEHKLKDV